MEGKISRYVRPRWKRVYQVPSYHICYAAINDMHVLGTLKGLATCTDWLDFKSCFRLSHSVVTSQEVQGGSDYLELIPSELSMRLSGVTRRPQLCTEGWAGRKGPHSDLQLHGQRRVLTQRALES